MKNLIETLDEESKRKVAKKLAEIISNSSENYDFDSKVLSIISLIYSIGSKKHEIRKENNGDFIFEIHDFQDCSFLKILFSELLEWEEIKCKNEGDDCCVFRFKRK